MSNLSLVEILYKRRCNRYHLLLSLSSVKIASPVVDVINRDFHQIAIFARLSFSQIKSWVALSSLVVCLFVRPSRIGDMSIYANIYRFLALMPVYIIYMMRVWWYLGVSDGVWSMSGGVWSMSGGVWSASGDVDGYRLIWHDLMYMGRYIFQCL